MIPEPSLRLAAAGLTLLPALVWWAVARDISRYVRVRKPRGPFARVLFPATAFEAIHYLAFMVLLLLPSTARRPGMPVFDVLVALMDVSVVVVVALSRHLVLLWPVRSERPSARWLVLNYGLCAVASAVVVVFDLGGATWSHNPTALNVVFNGYLLVIGGLIVHDLRRLGGRGRWRAGGVGDTRTADAVAIGAAFATVGLSTVLPLLHHTTFLGLLLDDPVTPLGLWASALHALGGLLFATPFVVRSLGDVLPEVATGVLMVTGAGTLLSAAGMVVARSDDEMHSLVFVATVLVLGLGFAPARSWVRDAVAHVLFGQGRRRWTAVQRALRSMSPEDGAAACCSHATSELVRSLGLRGVAILLHDGRVVAHGDIAVDDIRRVWSLDDPTLPARTISGLAFRDLPRPVGEALMAADVVVVVPIASPRRRWGHAFFRADLRGATFSDEEDVAIDGVADQLALLLDGCELLGRAVAVERALAHAEKLAAIGELAARVAHEIRNPVTAARSLAQQLAREPSAPFAEEMGIILEELERVERQVAALLRFARREELTNAPVDVGALVRATVEHCRPRLDAAGAAVTLDAPEGIVTRGDAEKLRQVLINLIENAADALASWPGTRALRLAVERTAERVAVAVRDSGPGVAADMLPRLVEPFFSSKPSGTGLGLAIAQRTVEAHGGRLVMTSPPGAGFSVTMELPA